MCRPTTARVVASLRLLRSEVYDYWAVIDTSATDDLKHNFSHNTSQSFRLVLRLVSAEHNFLLQQLLVAIERGERFHTAPGGLLAAARQAARPGPLSNS